MKFRKKPVVIEALQYTRNGLEAERVAEWCGGIQTDEGCEIKTLEGTMLADYGDWIIKGVKGEFYPCKPDIFEETYEPVPAVEPYSDAADRALRMIREATDHALDKAGLVGAVAVLISQRDNARHYAKTFRAKLKELGHEFV